MRRLNKILTVVICGLFPLVAYADSAAAWKDYQNSRNPMIEVGLLVVGAVIFFAVLIVVNNTLEKRKKKRKTSTKTTK